MAIAIMGALTVATLLAILFVPALYAGWFKVRRVPAGSADPVPGAAALASQHGALMARHVAVSDGEVLARARTVFLERGHGARTKQIAPALGRTSVAIAARFGNQRSLFRRVVRLVSADCIDLPAQS